MDAETEVFPLKTYSRDNFETLVLMIQKELGYNPYPLHEDVIDFCLPGDRNSMFRVTYHEKGGHIMVSFSVATYSTVAVAVFNWIKNQFKAIEIGAEYYVDLQGQNHFGEDAYGVHQSDIDQVSLQNTTDAVALEDPFTIIVPYTMFPAWDKRAMEDYNDFLKRRKMV